MLYTVCCETVFSQVVGSSKNRDNRYPLLIVFINSKFDLLFTGGYRDITELLVHLKDGHKRTNQFSSCNKTNKQNVIDHFGVDGAHSLSSSAVRAESALA